MRFLFKVRAVCAAATMLSACGPVGTGVMSSGFRHPLLHPPPVQSSQARSPDEIFVFHGGTREAGASPCIHRYRYPLLNRCQDWTLRAPDRPAGLRAASEQTIDTRLALARRARGALSGNGFAPGSRRDCSGFVLSVLRAEGVRPAGITDGGVADIYRWARERGFVHRRKVPAIGDLVFFSNTWDRNQDGRLNDPLTHIGIVERVDADGTVSFVHHVRRGVLRYKLNLFSPGLRREPGTRKVLNHYLRVGSRRGRHQGRRLTGELFHAFATIIR